MTSLTDVSGKVVVATFKPTVIDMHSRENLERFQEAASATGIGLFWPQWRYSIEVGSKLWNDFVSQGAIPEERVLEIKKGVGYGVVKKEPVISTETENEKEFAIFEKLASKFGFNLGKPELGKPGEEKGSATTTSTTTTTTTSKKVGKKGKIEIEEVDEEEPKTVIIHSSSSPFSSISSTSTSSSSSLIDLTKEDYTPNFVSSVSMKLLGISGEEMKQLGVGNQARYVWTVEGFPFEPEHYLNRRIEMWNWMVACLRKGKEKGPFSYLVDQVGRYDVAGLYKNILQSVDIQNPFVFFKNFSDFVNAKPEREEEIFSYFTRLRKMVSGLTIRDPEAIGVLNVKDISELALKLKLIEATSFYGDYRSYAQKIRTQKPSQWLKLTEDKIIEELRTIHDNSASMGSLKQSNASQVVTRRREQETGVGRGRSRSRGPGNEGGTRARSRSMGPPQNCPKGACWGYWNTGECSQKDCRFKHEKNRSEAKDSNFRSNERANKVSQHGGAKCGSCAKWGHETSSCNFDGQCDYCHAKGHKQACCNKKKFEDGKKKQGSADPAFGGPRKQAHFAQEGEEVAEEKEQRVPSMDA